MTTTAPDVVSLYGLTEDHLAFRSVIRQIVAERVAPRAAAIDAEAVFPEDIRRLFADHDLFGPPFEEAHGECARTDASEGEIIAALQDVRGGYLETPDY